VVSTRLLPQPRPSETNRPWWSYDVGMIHMIGDEMMMVIIMMIMMMMNFMPRQYDDDDGFDSTAV